MNSTSRPSVAVIGAGMGGLSAAIELASAGCEVTVYEAASVVGGKLHTQQIGDQHIDSGPTVFTMRWIFDALFEAAGRFLDDYVELTGAESLARHHWLDGSSLDLFTDLDRSCSAIEAFSSVRNADAYRRFVLDAGRVFDTLDHSFMRAPRPSPLRLASNVGWTRLGDLLATRPLRSLARELDQRFDDPRLVQLFARYATYCGSNPYLAPATLMLIAEAERRGVWYVRGGMMGLARGLRRLLEELGGELRLATAVEELAGLADGRIQLTDERGERQIVSAVIFNGDSQALAEGRLGRWATTATPHRKAADFSLSAVTLSLVGEAGGKPLAHHTVCFSDDYKGEFDTLWQRRQLPETPTLYLCAPASGTATRPIFVLANAPPDVFEDAALNDYQHRMLATLERHGILLQFAPDACIRRSPGDFAERFPASRGALYGRPTHGFAGSFTRPGAETGRPGLFTAGGSVHPGAGIPMATQSGRLAANAALAYLGAR